MGDSTLNYEAYIEELVKKGRAAQKIAEGYSQEQVDEICEALAYYTTLPEVALEIGTKLFEESGMGRPEDKVLKMYGKIKGAWAQMKGQKSIGFIERDERMGVEKYAKPMGVIGAIIPVTNGENTPVVKSMNAIKTRNAIILSPHPRAKETNKSTTELIRSILKKFDAPEDLVQTIEPEYVSIEASQALMKQVDFIVATGGTPMVRQAYSSGVPAIGVGTGNVVSVVDETADIADAAEKLVRSKSFDNATSCSTENNIIVIESVYDEWAAEMEKNNAVLIREGTPEKEKILKALWPESPANHNLNVGVVAKSALEIARLAEVDVPEGTRLLLVEENGGYGNDFPFTGEKLSPVAGVRKVKDFDAAIEAMFNILEYQGKGHSIGIHTKIGDRVTKLAEIVPVTKVVVNQPQSLTNSGSWTSGFPVSLTLGCATWGFNSISHNATWKDLLNYTYVSREVPSWQPPDDELFSQKTRDMFK